jgi:hypothetical protein
MRTKRGEKCEEDFWCVREREREREPDNYANRKLVC